MQVREIMTSDPKVIRPDASVADAAQIMRDFDVGAVPVCDGDRLLGMITDRDIAVRAVAESRDMVITRVRDVMSGEILTVNETSSVDEIKSLMGTRQVRRLPVVDATKKLVGMVSFGDIAQHPFTSDHAEEALSDISQPSHNEPSQVRQTTSVTSAMSQFDIRKFAYFVSGLTIGAALSYLLDPAQGSYRRQTMREKGLDLAQKATEYTTTKVTGMTDKAFGSTASAEFATQPKETRPDNPFYQ